MIIVSQTEAPPTAPTPPVLEAARGPMRWEWTAPWLERTWNLTDTATSVVKLAGAKGFGGTDPEHWWQDSPSLPGSVWNGSRTGRGSLFVPVMVQGSTPDEFLAENAAFKKSLDPGREGLFRITQADGRWREASCRFDSGFDPVDDLDVIRSMHAVYGITWAMADPFWRGEPVELRFDNAEGVDFFPGPPFTIGPGLSTADPAVVNPGDVDAYPVWRIEGPFTSFSVGIGQSLVEMTYTRGIGQWVEIDMDPRRLTILDDASTDLWEEVTEVSFSAIPPGQTDLTIGIEGDSPDSSVTLSFVPRYRGAW